MIIKARIERKVEEIAAVIDAHTGCTGVIMLPLDQFGELTDGDLVEIKITTRLDLCATGKKYL